MKTWLMVESPDSEDIFQFDQLIDLPVTGTTINHFLHNKTADD